MLDKFPRLRKLGINTTGLTPHRAIPMLTKIVEMCHERGVIFSTRVSIDGVGEMHNEVRQVKRGFEKAEPDHPRHAGAAEDATASTSASRRRSSHMNLDDAENILAWAKKEKLDIVFNMVRFTDADARQRRASADTLQADRRGRRADAPVLPRSRAAWTPLLDGQNYIYMHYADMIANGYHRHGAVPVPDPGHHAQSRRRPVLLREQRGRRQRARTRIAEEIYFRAASQAHRDMHSRREVPDLPEPVPDERRGDQAGRALREVPGARGPRESGATTTPAAAASSSARRSADASPRACSAGSLPRQSRNGCRRGTEVPR